MRPSVDEPDRVVLECYGCGRRERDPDDRRCPDCGITMRNLSRSTDL
jgi:rRNA maturation endonuclease Nob1